MKKKTVAILTTALALTFCGAISAPVISASANAVTKTVVTDDFGDKSYTGGVNERKWIKFDDEENAIKQVNDGTSSATLTFKNDANADNIFAVSTEKYKMKSVTFDAYYSENFDNASRNWGALGFSQTTDKKQSMYKAPLLLRCNGFAGNTATVAAGSATTFEGAGNWITFKYEFTSANTFKFYVAKKGEAFGAGVVVTGAADAVYNDAYLTFAVSGIAPGASFAIDNIVIEKDDATTVGENFENMEDLKFQIVRKDSSKAVRAIVYSPDSLHFDNASDNARMVTKNVVALDESILKQYKVMEAEFTVQVASGAISFVYGLSQTSSNIASMGAYEYVMTATEGTLYQYNAAGEATEIGKNVFASVGSEDGAKMSVVIDKVGTMKVYENGEQVKDADGKTVVYNIQSYAGYVAFASAAEGTSGKVDDVVIQSSTYFVPYTKSLTNNFSTDYVGGEDTLDFYMTSTPNKTLKIENDKLCFDGCSDGTLFGTCYEYDDFILDYKLTDIYVGTDEVDDMDKTGVGRWFGLDIARPNYDTSYYGHYLMLYFNIVLNDSVANTSLNAFVTSGGPTPETMQIEQDPIPMSLFRDISYDGESKLAEDIPAEDAVCVRWVAENNVLKLYMKKASEVQFTWYATVSGIETNGYLSLCCTGFTHMHLDDFSLANTSTVYTCASNEAPEKQIIEVEAPYDYNKYRDNDANFEKELNYLNATGCGSSVSGIILPTLLVGAVGYFVFRKKEDK